MEQVIRVTGRQFWEKQKNYLELADKGARIILTDIPTNTKEDYDNLINKSSGRLINGMEKWL